MTNSHIQTRGYHISKFHDSVRYIGKCDIEKGKKCSIFSNNG